MYIVNCDARKTTPDLHSTQFPHKSEYFQKYTITNAGTELQHPYHHCHSLRSRFTFGIYTT